MPPKAKPAATTTTTTTSQVYVVLSGDGDIDSVHASIDSANERIDEAKAEGSNDVVMEVQELQGGSVQIDQKKPAAKPKSKAKVKAPKDEEDEDEDEDEPPKPKTKPAAEQRAANSAKGKATKSADEDLPENVQHLLANPTTALAGFIVVVTGVPPTLGRKNAEKLVETHGGKLGKSITGKTSYVVLGNDAGPKKLEQIEQHNIDTLDEDALIELLEGGGASSKRSVEDNDEKPAKAKKQKK
ncbi:Replication factor C subunit [Lachnellula subtilissima]|uniref:Replication factor C subunit n=1 Tax=Lachnellula subtilissima TaxID=602034 RepID=A0A8H8UFY8_9HELO|nr:Replication factor C subunit [Lachnellula subtilissima]